MWGRSKPSLPNSWERRGLRLTINEGRSNRRIRRFTSIYATSAVGAADIGCYGAAGASRPKADKQQGDEVGRVG